MKIGMGGFLLGVACLAAFPAEAGKTALRRMHYPDAALRTAFPPVSKAVPRLPAKVVFRTVGALRVEDGRWVALDGELVNPLNKPVEVELFSGGTGSPFSLSPHLNDQVRWRPPRPGEVLEPPAPPPPFRITLPAHTVVAFTARFDLDKLEYAGTPEGVFGWYFGFSRQREAMQGEMRLALPPR